MGTCSLWRRGEGDVDKILKKYLACPEKPFLSKQLFCIVTPTMSVDSNEIFIKKEKKSRLKVYSIFDALPKEYYQQNH